MQHLTWDGRQLKALAAAGLNDAYYSSRDEADTVLAAAIAGGMTALAANNHVPWLFRAVAKRASLVSNMPFALMRGETEVTDAPEYVSLLKSIRRNLYRVEASKTLFGAGYWYIDANASGRNITLRWLRKLFVEPREVAGQLVGFQYTGRELGVQRDIPLERIVYFWNENHVSATRPGPGEAQVALGPASVLYAIDAYAAGFFNSGGVKVTVFQAPPQMSQGDKEEFQSFLNRALSGVRNAFRNIVIRAKIEPTVIGSDLKETEAPELTEQERQAVAVALGIPPPVIDGLHENRATADVVTQSMYTETIIPEFELLCEAANEQLFERFGLALEARPDELEALQSAQLTQAQAIQVVVGKPVLTVTEGRALLGYEPMTKEQVDEATPPPAPNPFGQPPAAQAPAPPEAETPEEVPAPDEDEQAQAKKPAKTSEQFEALIAQYAAWRKAALAVPGQGVGAPFDDELAVCKSKADVRAVFERRWPRAAPVALTAADVLVELRAARLAAERLAA